MTKTKETEETLTPRKLVSLEELLTSKAAVSPEDLVRAGFPLSRMSIYQACNVFLRGEQNGIECMRYGKRIVIPTKPLRDRFHIAAPQSPGIARGRA